MTEFLKRSAFHSIGAADRLIRGVRGRNPSLNPTDLRMVRNFVVPLTHSYLGAAIHETPLLEALRKLIPEAQIIAAGQGLAAEVYRNHPALSRVEPAPNPNIDFWGAVRHYRRIADFGNEPWCALFTTWNSRSRVALAMMLAGAGIRAGFTVSSPLLHLPLEYDAQRSQIENNLRLPALLGHRPPNELEPRVYFTHADLAHAQGLLASDPERPTAVLITRTSGGQPTRWPDNRFAAVARHLTERHCCRVVLPGTAQDADSLARLAEQIGPDVQSLAGTTSIPQLAAVCALSDIAVAVDTGAMHVARSQELPLVIIAPGWQNSIEWMPLGKPWVRILKGPWFSPPPPANYAIEEVSVEEAKAAMDDLLKRFPPSREARLRRAVDSLTRLTHTEAVAS